MKLTDEKGAKDQIKRFRSQNWMDQLRDSSSILNFVKGLNTVKIRQNNNPAELESEQVVGEPQK